MHVNLELAAAGLECKQYLALLQQGLPSSVKWEEMFD